MGLMTYATETDGTKRSRIVTLDELKKCNTPPPQGPRHKPVPHYDLVSQILDSLDSFGFDVLSKEVAVGMRRKGADGVVYPDTTVFGVVDVKARPGTVYAREGANPSTDEYVRTLGFRSNHVKKMAIKLVAGARVFVCDNLCISGEKTLCNRTHTNKLDLPWEINSAMHDFVRQGKQFDLDADQMQEWKLDDRDAHALLYRMFADKVLPLRFLPKVHSNYFEPSAEWTDCTPRTAWGTYNAATRVLREVPLNQRLTTTSRLTRFVTSQHDLN